MATIEDALFSHLSGSTSVTGLLGSTTPSHSINPVHLDQQADLPAVTIHRISGLRVSAFSEDTDAAEARFRFSNWAKRYDDAKELKEAVRKAIQRFSGTVEGVQIDDIMLDNDRALFEDELETYQLQLDAIVHYRETT